MKVDFSRLKDRKIAKNAALENFLLRRLNRLVSDVRAVSLLIELAQLNVALAALVLTLILRLAIPNVALAREELSVILFN